jgi:hypothetical protein
MIAPPQATLITLSFTMFSIQAEKDIVKVFQCIDVACLQQQQLADLSGWHSSGSQVVTATTGFMKVVFTSDASVNYDGFKASWTSVSHTVLQSHQHILLYL